MSVTRIDAATCRVLRGEIDTALESIARSHGITLRIGNIKFNDNNFTATLVGAVIESDGTVVTRETQDFRMHARMFGLLEDDLGRAITLEGKRYKIVGLRVNAPKRPIILEGVDGRRSVCTPVMVRFALSGEACDVS